MANESKGGLRGLLTSRPAKSASYDKPRAITASASRVRLNDREEVQELKSVTGQKWQSTAWKNYDQIGEVKFAFSLTAAILSRIRLYPGVITDPGQPPTQLTDAVEIDRGEQEQIEGVDPDKPAINGIPADLAVKVRDEFNRMMGSTSVPSLLRSYALNMSVPGECLILHQNGRLTIRSTDEIRIMNSELAQQIDYPGATPKDIDRNKVTVGRVWREHPRYHRLAESSMMSINPPCDELLMLSQSIRGIARSNMNAGLLYVPDEITVAARSVTDETEVEAAEEDAFENEIDFALSEPIKDELAGNSVKPVILRGPAGLADSIKHISLSRSMDQFMVDRADRLLDRILQGIDVPKDMVTGLSNVKYSNGVQITDSFYKSHIEPLALVLVDAITDVFLRPLLKASLAGEGSGDWSEEDIEKIVVWFDPSDISVRPDRVEDAALLYDKGELSGDALRRVAGFADTDAPTDNEIARKLALGNTLPPEVADVLIRFVLPDLLGDGNKSSDLPDTLEDTLNGEVPAEDPAATAVETQE